MSHEKFGSGRNTHKMISSGIAPSKRLADGNTNVVSNVELLSKYNEPKDLDVGTGVAIKEKNHRVERCYEGIRRLVAGAPVKLAIDSSPSTDVPPPPHTTPMERNDEEKSGRSQLISRGHIISSPAPPKANAVDASSTNTPASHPSRDTLALARLYHSSRRSRHRDGGLGNWDVVSLNSIAPPPLASSSSLDSAKICSRMDDLDDRVKLEEEERSWSFTVASPLQRSCSSSSLSSIESAEREPKRRKTTPKR